MTAAWLAGRQPVSTLDRGTLSEAALRADILSKIKASIPMIQAKAASKAADPEVL